MNKYKNIILTILCFVLINSICFGIESVQRITDIRFWQSPEEAQVVLDLTQYPNVSVVTRLDDGTLYFDIKSCAFKPGKQVYQLKNQFLESLTVQQNDFTQTTRILFKVPRGVEHKTMYFPSNETKGDRIVIFLKEPHAALMRKQSDELKEVKRLKAQNIKIVVLDPGHGGEDPGTSSNGIIEKSYVLAMAKLVKAYFDRDPRYKAILTRESDFIIPLEKRRKIAERFGADAFVSIHVNYNVRRSISGIEVYYESPKGAVNEADRLVEENENNSDLEIFGSTNPTITASKNQIAQMQATIMDQSRQLAEKVENKLAGCLTNLESRGVKRAGFRVLHSLNMPSILVEYGYTSNLQDATVLKDYTSRAKLAQALYLGISDFLQHKVENGLDTEYLEYYRNMNVKKQKSTKEKKANSSTISTSKQKTSTTKTVTKTTKKVSAPTKKHTVKQGDTLSSISRKYSVALASLMKINKLKQTDIIKPGQVLVIPEK